jgi:hypothetical protein
MMIITVSDLAEIQGDKTATGLKATTGLVRNQKNVQREAVFRSSVYVRETDLLLFVVFFISFFFTSSEL